MESLLPELPPWASNFVSLENLLQVGVFILLFVIAAVPRPFLRRQLKKLEARAQNWSIAKELPWLVDLPSLLQGILYPLTTYLFGHAAIRILTSLTRPTDFLEWAVPFLALWTGYRFLKSVIKLRMKPEQATFWVKHIIRPLAYLTGLLLALGLLDDVLAISFQPSQEILITLRSLGIGLVIIYVFWVLGRQVRIFLHDRFLPNTGLEPSLNHIISNLTAYALIAAGTLMGISTIGINLTILTVLVGGLSVGIGFGMQTIFNNWISGFILLFERTIKPGDVIEVNGKITRVVNIGLRSMTVRTNANVEMIVPNGKLLEDIIVNYTLNEKEAEVPINVRVPHDVNLHEVYGLLMQAADEHEEVIYGLLRTQDFVEGSFLVRLMIYIPEPIKIFKIQHEVRTRIWELFQEHNIPLAFPERNIHLQVGDLPLLSSPAPQPTE